MNYSSHQYAEALHDALDGKTDTERAHILRTCVALLFKHKKTTLLERIIAAYEHIYLKKSGLKKVDVESVSPLSGHIKKEIETALGGNVLMTEKTNPDLIAGLTISVDDSLFIDASAKKIINNLFI